MPDAPAGFGVDTGAGVVLVGAGVDFLVVVGAGVFAGVDFFVVAGVGVDNGVEVVPPESEVPVPSESPLVDPN